MGVIAPGAHHFLDLFVAQIFEHALFLCISINFHRPIELSHHLVAMLETSFRQTRLFNHVLAEDCHEFVELTRTVHLRHILFDGRITTHLRIARIILVESVTVRVAADRVEEIILVLLVVVLVNNHFVRSDRLVVVISC